MSKCPFWSSNKEKVNCNSKCPMYPAKDSNEVCPFVQYLVEDKFIFKDIIEDNFNYSEINRFDYIIPKYACYKR